MRVVEITPDYSVSPQLGVPDVAEVRELGFRSILCNRPDGEEAGQPEVAAIRQEAERLGLIFAWVPVVSGAITGENVEDFAAAFDALPKPVLAYCRSGGRCQNLWMLAQRGRAARAR
ncbi:TIGR01244 family sulfur transferase [Amaricoccus sp.]|uniref:TIGR01244 family sulfur transferase n=1 Tax=Amaricoccus sp. TaxID=1872485 RepID=UPI002613777C|nr:TIGR01244 family sulfur transferase [Amaricoccus sp.]HRO11382.1 TIGR01244 family sulfur transferase [Amaricoccus sp.]